MSSTWGKTKAVFNITIMSQEFNFNISTTCRYFLYKIFADFVWLILNLYKLSNIKNLFCEMLWTVIIFFVIFTKRRFVNFHFRDFIYIRVLVFRFLFRKTVQSSLEDPLFHSLFLTQHQPSFSSSLLVYMNVCCRLASLLMLLSRQSGFHHCQHHRRRQTF